MILFKWRIVEELHIRRPILVIIVGGSVDIVLVLGSDSSFVEPWDKAAITVTLRQRKKRGQTNESANA